jgi:hypothetical protein
MNIYNGNCESSMLLWKISEKYVRKMPVYFEKLWTEIALGYLFITWFVQLTAFQFITHYIFFKFTNLEVCCIWILFTLLIYYMSFLIFFIIYSCTCTKGITLLVNFVHYCKHLLGKECCQLALILRKYL